MFTTSELPSACGQAGQRIVNVAQGCKNKPTSSSRKHPQATVKLLFIYCRLRGHVDTGLCFEFFLPAYADLDQEHESAEFNQLML